MYKLGLEYPELINVIPGIIYPSKIDVSSILQGNQQFDPLFSLHFSLYVNRLYNKTLYND